MSVEQPNPDIQLGVPSPQFFATRPIVDSIVTFGKSCYLEFNSAAFRTDDGPVPTTVFVATGVKAEQIYNALRRLLEEQLAQDAASKKPDLSAN